MVETSKKYSIATKNDRQVVLRCVGHMVKNGALTLYGENNEVIGFFPSKGWEFFYVSPMKKEDEDPEQLQAGSKKDILDALYGYWMTMPALRLGQTIHRLMEDNKQSSTFYITNGQWRSFLAKHMKGDEEDYMDLGDDD